MLGASYIRGVFCLITYILICTEIAKFIATCCTRGRMTAVSLLLKGVVVGGTFQGGCSALLSESSQGVLIHSHEGLLGHEVHRFLIVQVVTTIVVCCCNLVVTVGDDVQVAAEIWKFEIGGTSLFIMALSSWWACFDHTPTD